MKTFYARRQDTGAAAVALHGAGPNGDAAHGLDPADSNRPIHIRTRARIAVYDSPASAPRVEVVEPLPVGEFIESLASRVYELARSAGGSIPYTVVREVTENFIHADFSEPVVSVLDQGETLRFADQGPGIRDRDRAVLPGFTTAREPMKEYIRGVGSGLPIVRDYLSYSGGTLSIEDNLGTGAVVTVRAGSATRALVEQRAVGPVPPAASQDTGERLPGFAGPSALEPVAARSRLSTRQKQVLALVLESGEAGPSLVSKELGVGISTAYRDLASLEEAGLISAVGGKRTLTSDGLAYLDSLNR